MDDSRADHPKMLAVGLAARGLDEACIEWCSRHETDGRIPTSAVAMIAAGHGTVTWKPLAKKLVDHGRWVPVDDGFLIHGYLDYNPSAADRQAAREAAAERQKRHRHGGSNSVSHGVTPGVTNSVTNADVTPSVTPPPSRPVPTRPDMGITSSSLTLVGEPASDDEDLINQGLRILAERSLERREAAKGAVGNREAWLTTAVSTLHDRHEPTIRKLSPLPGTPQHLADILEPPRSNASDGGAITRDGRTFLPGSGWL